MKPEQEDGGPAQTPPQKEYMAMMREANSPETKDRNLRDYFAAAALQGILAQPLESDWAFSPELCAGSAYEYADAMIQARKEGA
jgi:hypothetical protein